MKAFKIAFPISYAIFTVIWIWLFGNMNFFGEQGFHIDAFMLIIILTQWSMIPSLVIGGVAALIYKLKNPKQEIARCPKCGRIANNADKFCPECGTKIERNNK